MTDEGDAEGAAHHRDPPVEDPPVESARVAPARPWHDPEQTLARPAVAGSGAHEAVTGARVVQQVSGDSAPPPPSYEPDPAVYDVADDAEDVPRKRRFGRRRPTGAPAGAGTDAAEAGTDAAGAGTDAAALVVPHVQVREPGATHSSATVAPSYVPEPLEAPEPPQPPLPAAEVHEPAAEPKQDVEPAEPEAEAEAEAEPDVDPERDTQPEDAPDARRADAPGPLAKAVRWLSQRAPEPAPGSTPPDAEPASIPRTETVPDALPGPGHARIATTERAHRGWRRRRGAPDDDEGPFFPSEAGTPRPAVSPAVLPELGLPAVAAVVHEVPVPTPSEVPAVPVPAPEPSPQAPSASSDAPEDRQRPVARDRPRPRPRPAIATGPPTPVPAEAAPREPDSAAPARQRPRPRPAAPRATASPAADTETEPDPAGSPSSAPPALHREPQVHHEAARHAAGQPAAPNERDDDDDPGYRSPDITRYLTPHETAGGAAEASTGSSVNAATPGVADTADPAEPPESQPSTATPASTTPATDRDTSMRRRHRLRGSRLLRTGTRVLIVLAVVVLAAVALRAYVVAPYYIPSASMEPTLKGGGGGSDDRILVDKFSYHVHDPHEGDIVVFDRPDTWQVPDKTLVKRIIGLPGDRVSLRAGLVYVNGLRLSENYLNKACGSAPTKPLNRTSQWTVPMDDYFVMGDNRCDSEDSRLFGPVPGSAVVGRAFVVYWPLSHVGTP